MMTTGQTTALLIEAKKGDQTALNDLYDRVGNRLLALVRVRLGPSLLSRVQPEDVVQEVLLKACVSIADLEQDTSRSFFAWLAVIASNTIRDLAAFYGQPRRDMKRTHSHRDQESELTAKHRSALSRILVDERYERLTAALKRLPDHYREIIILRRWEERSFREIAEILGRSEDGCRMLLARALAKLTMIMDSDPVG